VPDPRRSARRGCEADGGKSPAGTALGACAINGGVSVETGGTTGAKTVDGGVHVKAGDGPGPGLHD
jgi:hypothetical protein